MAIHRLFIGKFPFHVLVSNVMVFLSVSDFRSASFKRKAEKGTTHIATVTNFVIGLVITNRIRANGIDRDSRSAFRFRITTRWSGDAA